MDSKTYTLTFGDQAENHIGMQKIGTLASEGFNLSDMIKMRDWFVQRGCSGMMVDLTASLPEGISYDGDAYVMIIHKGLNTLLSDYKGSTATSDSFYQEQDVLEKDKKALMKGRVVNKIARYNLCFNHERQEPDYEKGKGTIVPFSDVPLLSHVRDKFGEILGPKGKDLMVEGNYYYDISKCYIGYHGDSERRKVIGVRVGSELPLHFQWFTKFKPLGDRIELSLTHGDIYMMSEKAVGTDWKKSSILTLRHAAGAPKYLEIK